jgi:hypothetical protein
MINKLAVIAEEQHEDPLSVFMYALKAPETKRQWPGKVMGIKNR